jgi:uncharacterized protein (DUF983 family)
VPDPTPIAIDRLPGPIRLIGRGLTRRCAWCGDWHGYFVSWFRRQDRCRRCGHGYRRGDNAFELGAVTANTILTFLAIMITILVTVVATAPEVSVGWVVGAAAGVALVAPAVLYPISFTLWQAIDLSMRPPTPAELAGEGDAVL